MLIDCRKQRGFLFILRLRKRWRMSEITRARLSIC